MCYNNIIIKAACMYRVEEGTLVFMHHVTSNIIATV